MEAGYSRNGGYLYFCYAVDVHSTDNYLVHARSRLKKASRRYPGDLHLQAAATLHLCEKSSQNRRVAIASPISMLALHRLDLHLPAKALQIRLAEDAQARFLHDSLPSAPATVSVARNHRLAPEARRTPLLAPCMAQPHQPTPSSKLQPAPPIPAARHYFRGSGQDPCHSVETSSVAHLSDLLCLLAIGWLEETGQALCRV